MNKLYYVPIFQSSYAGVSSMGIHMNQVGNAYVDIAEKAQRELLYAGYLHKMAMTKRNEKQTKQEVQK